METKIMHAVTNHSPFHQALLIAARPDGAYECSLVLWTVWHENDSQRGGAHFWGKNDLPVFFEPDVMNIPTLATSMKVWRTDTQNIAEPWRVKSIAELEKGKGTFLAAEFMATKDELCKSSVSSVQQAMHLIHSQLTTTADYDAWLSEFAEEIVL